MLGGAMAQRTFERPVVARLHEELAAAGVPVVTVRRLQGGNIEIEYAP